MEKQKQGNDETCPGTKWRCTSPYISVQILLSACIGTRKGAGGYLRGVGYRRQEVVYLLRSLGMYISTLPPADLAITVATRRRRREEDQLRV